MASVCRVKMSASSTRAFVNKSLAGARRKVAAGATARGRDSRPNWLLEEPARLWEIGSNYWLPFSPYTPPEYLDGSLPGDRGFDPFRLGATWGQPPIDEEADSRTRLGWLLEGELYNGRLAMLAVIGVLTVDALGKGPWWTAPYTASWPLPYAVGVVGGHVIFALLEKKRLENFKEKGEAGHFGMAPFDPLGITDDYKRQAEVRNCRLAMLTFAGFAAQAWVTGKGPIQNALDHLSAPFENNIFTQGEKGLTVVYYFMAFSIAMHLVEIARGKKAARA